MERAPSGDCALVLQGGGALGAYQAGAFHALSRERFAPNWVSGISIGAINCALIAGNAREKRVQRLREFWEMVSSGASALPLQPDARGRAIVNGASALRAVLFGVPGFFVPRIPPAAFQAPGTLAAISYYDTAPLKSTLERLVDFDRINAGDIRLSVEAVNVRTGNYAYFDSAKQRIDVRHIMASAALPPGFPPIEIDGEYYWDGGLVSNTPLQYVLDQPGIGNCTVFQVDLFPARGKVPATLAQVTQREKDIRYSSRSRLNTNIEVAWRKIAESAERLIAKLPSELRSDPDAQELLAQTQMTRAAVDIVHLIYRAKQYESEWKDYEFSRWTMREHWSAGYADVVQTLRDPRWTERPPAPYGVRVFDFVEPQRTRAAQAAADFSTGGLIDETA
jgi:NTE family protein